MNDSSTVSQRSRARGRTVGRVFFGVNSWATRAAARVWWLLTARGLTAKQRRSIRRAMRTATTLLGFVNAVARFLILLWRFVAHRHDL